MSFKVNDVSVAVAQSQPPPPVQILPSEEGWYWQENDGTWHRFEQSTSGILSSALDSSTNISVSFNHNGCSYTIDKSTMIQTNVTTGKQRSVLRVGSKPITKSTRTYGAMANAYLWFWQADDGSWDAFKDDDSNIIDNKFSQNPNSTVNLSYNNHNYEIDLANKVQTNKQTGRTRPILRVQSHLSLPISRRVSRKSVWQMKADDGSWIDFDSAPMGNSVSSDAVMTAWLQNKNGKIMFHAQRFLYSIDFSQMTQKNMKTSKVRSIQLTQIVEDTKFPSTWDHRKDFVNVPLSPTSNEYKYLIGLFSKTMPNSRVKCVKRIQNSALYQPFNVYKMQLESRLGKGNGVRHLFHGTKRWHIDGICKQGFDSRLHTVYAYGKGSYFARDASYSATFTDCNMMFLAEVSHKSIQSQVQGWCYAFKSLKKYEREEPAKRCIMV